MKKIDRYRFFLNFFKKKIPNPQTELVYKTPFQLLVAVVLSAQCTDERVNKVTPELFKKFPNANKLAKGSFKNVFGLIKSISYPNNKTKHIIGLSKILVTKFNSQIPNSSKKLESLPGVGRKTSNVILSVLYKKAKMAVDTHVFRVSRRIGLVKEDEKSLIKVEEELIKNISKKLIPLAHHWLILHGRYTCLARKPNCDSCGISKVCRYYHKLNVS